MSGHCHKLVAKQAKEAADELYEVLMKDNLMYGLWKKQNPGLNDKRLRLRFVARNWGRCIPFARATMARMLTMPIDEGLKETILEALSLDATLMRGRMRGEHVLGAVQQRSNND